MKAIRCPTRKEKSCKDAPEDCEWDSILQKCIKKQKATTKTKSPSPGKQSPLSKNTKDCSIVKTKVTCVKRDNCEWKDKKCVSKHAPSPNNARLQNKTGTNSKVQKQEIEQEIEQEQKKTDEQVQIEVLKRAIDRVLVDPGYDKKGTLAVNQNDDKFLIQGVNKYRLDLFREMLEENRFNGDKCKVNRIMLSANSLKNDVTWQIQDQANKSLATLHKLDTKSIIASMKQMDLAEMYFVKDVYAKRNDRLYFDKYIEIYTTRNGKCFITVDGCFPAILPKAVTVLGIPIHNISIHNPGLAKFVKTQNMTRFEPDPYYQINHGDLRLRLSDKEVRQTYISNSSSTELNLSMMLYMLEREPIPNDVRERILIILDVFRKISNTKLKYEKPVVLYHGTSQPIHTTRTFVTSAFFSTTTNIDVAGNYAQNRDGIIYIISLPPRFPFINLRDEDLWQILLPIGTTIMIDKTISIESMRYVFCHVVDAPIDFDRFIDFFSKSTFADIPIALVSGSKHPLLAGGNTANLVFGRENLKGSSSFWSTIGGSVKDIVKDIVKALNPVRSQSNDNQVFMRVLNEILASQVYKRVYNLETLDMKFLYRREVPGIPSGSTFMIISRFVNITSANQTYSYALRRMVPKLDISKETRKNVIAGFFVDCILGNWDVFNNDNIGILDNGKVIRSDVGGCAAFRGKGDYNILYEDGRIPRDHTSLALQNSFVNFMFNKDDMQHATRHLLGTTKVSAKLDEVKADVFGFLDLITDTEFSQKYKRFVDKICSTILYRDAWYRHNHEKAIDDMFKIYTSMNMRMYNANNTDITTTTPNGFAMSPVNLKRAMQ